MHIIMKKLIIALGMMLLATNIFAQHPTILNRNEVEMQGCTEWVETRLASMSLKEKIGQLFIHTVAPLETQQNRKNIEDAVKEFNSKIHTHILSSIGQFTCFSSSTVLS